MTRRTVLRLMILAVAVLPLTGCSYNTFVSQEEAIKAQWAQVQSQLQRRNDLIPNLVETVKGYAAHEESVYKDIADARSRLLAAKSRRNHMMKLPQTHYPSPPSRRFHRYCLHPPKKSRCLSR